MQREAMIEWLVAAASRPHRQCHTRICVSRPLRLQIQQHGIRYASTTPQSSRNPQPPFPPSADAPPPPPPNDPKPSSSTSAPYKSPTAHIPLHVGLDRNPTQRSAISQIPIPRGEANEVFTPSTLSRPLGLLYPPQPGQNTPKDRRTIAERARDFTSYDKALERRKVYLRTYLRPYFQEWKRANYHRGKSFVSNKALFKREKARFFPNIWGETLDPMGDGMEGGRDMCDVLRGKVTLVGIQSGRWAEEQVDTFLGEGVNPELKKLMETEGESGGKGVVQRADVNIQGDVLRMWLVRMFKNKLRQMVPEERWKRYFMVKLPRDIRPGLTDEIRDAMGLLNSQVGYVYLLDRECRIRWAGSGDAWEGERESLNMGVRRLIEEAKGK